MRRGWRWRMGVVWDGLMRVDLVHFQLLLQHLHLGQQLGQAVGGCGRGRLWCRRPGRGRGRGRSLPCRCCCCCLRGSCGYESWAWRRAGDTLVVDVPEPLVHLPDVLEEEIINALFTSISDTYFYVNAYHIHVLLIYFLKENRCR